MTDTWAGVLSSAVKALTTKIPGQNDPHRYAPDRASRIVRTVDRLFDALPPNQRPERVDLARVAGMYCCNFWMGTPKPRAGPLDGDLEDAAEWAAEQLGNHMTPQDIDLTLRILREHPRKESTLKEAHLLGDAVALEDLGLIGFWNQTRYFHHQGRTLEQLVRYWQTQLDYGYWEARLRDGFHFEVSKKIAQKRLEQSRALYQELLRQHMGEDITDG